MKLKTMITLMMLSLCVIIDCSSFNRRTLWAVEKDDKANPTKKGVWNFEIQNKYSDKITMDGEFDQRDHVLTDQKDSRKIRIKDVDVAKGFIIAIKTRYQTIEKSIKANQNRKTIYLTIGTDLTVYPQTGTFMGISGKTDSGLKLNKNTNVKKEEINPFEVVIER